MSKRSVSSLVLAGLVMSLLPSNLLAATSCSVSALDTIAGLGTQVSFYGCEADASLEFAVQGPSGSVYTQLVQTDASGNAATLVPSRVTTTAGSYRVSYGSKSATFNVIADRADDAHSILSASPRSIGAGGQETVTVMAVLHDQYDNPVSGRPLGLISSRNSDVISRSSGDTDEDGAASWNVRPTEPGTARFVVYDVLSGEQLKLSAEVQVGKSVASTSTYAAALSGFETGGEEDTSFSTPLVDRFELSLPDGATSVAANELFSVRIRAMQGTAVVRSYIGTLIVEAPDDPDAELPKKGEDPRSPDTGRIDMTNVYQGERNVPLSFLFKRRGEQTIVVYDKLDPAIGGTLTIMVEGETHSAGGELTIESPLNRSSIKAGPSVLIQGRGPTLINLVVLAGNQRVRGSVDDLGVFRIEVPLNPEDKQVTFYVRSEDGPLEAEPVTVFVDGEAPVIDTADIVPSEGKATEKAAVRVQSETGLASVTASVDGQTTMLTETGSGLYTGEITAPAKAGTYDVKFEAKDSVGNAGTLLVKWKVDPKSVPVVQGLAAENQAGRVKLTWNAVEGYPIVEYKIYVAKQSEPENTLYSLPTGKKPVTSAVVTGLPPGIPYLFALTAIGKDGEEGAPSDPVVGMPLGIALKATPGKQHVVLSWTAPENLPLAKYILEYGTEPGQYSEMRTVSGDAKTMTVRDLIGDLRYEFKLTPVAVTGKKLDEMASTVAAIPLNGSFVMASDPAPDGSLDGLHSGAPLQDYKPKLDRVPSVTGSGISSVALAGALIAAAFLVMYVRSIRRERRLVSAFLQDMQDRYAS